MLAAAKERSLQPHPGLLAPLTQNSHQGLRLSTAVSHPAFGPAISQTPTGLANHLYDFGVGPRCSGYFRDAESGNDYAGQRYTSPGMGRFITPDRGTGGARPSNPGTWNLYAYSGGDPINNIDPLGAEYCSVDFCVTGYGTAGDGTIGSGGPVGNSSGGGNSSNPQCGLLAEDGAAGNQSAAEEYETYCLAGYPNTQSSGSAGTGGNVAVGTVYNTGNDELIIDGAILSLETFIDPSCLSWLQSGGSNFNDYVSALLSSGVVGYGTITTTRPNSIVNAVEGGTPGYAIVFNSGGAFFNSSGLYTNSSGTYSPGQTGPLTVDNGQIAGGTVEAQIFLAIHEIAHSLGVLGPDSGSQNAVNTNDSAINKNCSKTLNLFK
jgi:RHS repeat-associated protein